MKTRRRISSSSKNQPAPLIVGIGTSAGGLEPVRSFLAELEDHQPLPLALVIVQHREASGDELLANLLQSVTSFQIVQPKRRTTLKAGTICIAPAQQLLELREGVAFVENDPDSERPHSPVDHFLASLARDQKSKAVGIILSGAGSDGAIGLKTISETGGLTFAQDLGSAKFESMPRNAIVTGVADHVLPPREIARELVSYIRHIEEIARPESEQRLVSEIEASIPEIAKLLKKATQHNFQHYKTSTLCRRIQRRIHVLRQRSVEDYVQRLTDDQTEVRTLFRDLLIGITRFFRDPEVFEAVDQNVICKLFEDARRSEGVRIWVPGCATGEEAYTIAILCREHMDRMAKSPSVQIFASDIDERALQLARDGIYPSGIRDDISEERLNRYFVKRGKKFQVKKELRELVLFSPHNLISDPPFSRLDFISCRNLLIYLGPHLQKKLIPLFHYALRPSGFLLLGPSETISSHRELFRMVDNKHRISMRKGTAVGARAAIALSERDSPPSDGATPPAVNASSSDDLMPIMQRIVLDEFAPKSVVVNADGQVLCASADMNKFLTVAEGNFQNHIVKMARSGLRIGLRTALAEANKAKRRVTHEDMSVRVDGQVQRVMITVQPMPRLGEDEGLFLVVFHEVGTPLSRDDLNQSPAGGSGDSRMEGRNDADAIIDHLERELEGTRDDLERAMQDMEAANEELKSSNEELLSMNEELQSANEELETSKEEIQLGSEAVARANDDLENLLRSTQIATVFLDDELNIRSFTPAINAIYDLLPSDVGRRLERFVPSVIEMPPLPAPDRLVDGDVVEDTVQANSGKTYIRRVLPYHSSSGEAEGVVVTFTDVTELHESEERLALALDATSEGAWDWNVETGAVIYSDQWIDSLGYARDEITPTIHFWESLVHADDVEKTRSLLKNHFSGETDTFSCENRLRMKSGEYRWNLDRGRVVEWRADGTPRRMVGTSCDIGDAMRSRLELEARERQLKTITDALPPSIAFVDQDQRYQFVNAQFAKQFDRSVDELIGQQVRHVVGEANYATIIPHLQRGLSGERHQYDLELSIPESREVQFKQVTYVPEHDDAGNVIGCHVIAIDLTERKRNEQRLTEALQRLDLSLAASGAAAWSWDIFAGQPELSDAMKRLFGFESEAAPLFDDFMERIHDDDRDRIKRANLDVMRGGGHYEEEYRVVLPDERIRWLRAVGKAEMDASGALENFYGVALDITDAKEREFEILDREAHLRRVIDNMLGFVGILDAAGVLLEANETALEAGGVTRNEVLGKPFWDCYWWNFDDQVAQRLRRSVVQAASGEVVRYDETVRMAGDTRIIIDFMLVPVVDEAGNVTHIIPSAIDITERKEAEKELAVREAHLRRLIDNQLGLVGLVDKNGILLDIDRNSMEIAGLTRDDVIGKHFADCAWWTYDDAVALRMRETMQRAFAGETIRYDVELNAAGLDIPQKRLWIDFMMTPIIDASGEVEYLIPSGVDISDRKREEDARKRSEQQLKLGIEVAQFGMAHIDCRSGAIALSEEAARIYGLGKEAVVISREALYAIAHPEDVDAVRDEIEACLAAGRENFLSREHRIVLSTGEVRWLDLRLQVIGDTGVEFDGMAVASLVVRDITEHKMATIELESKTQRLQQALQAGGMAAWEWSPQGSHWTPELYDLIGVDPQHTACPETFFEAVHPDDVEGLKAAWARATADEDRYNHLFRIIRHGAVRWIRGVGEVVRDDRGEVQGMFGLNWDETDEKEFEDKIRLNEERIRVAAGAAGFGTFHIDLEKQQAVWSDEIKHLVGLSDNDTVAIGIGVVPPFVHPEDHDEVQIFLDTILRDENENDHQIDHRIVRPDGEIRHVRMQSRSIFDQDERGRRLKLIVGTLFDITLQREYELSLERERQVAQSANESKSEFLANMSHEIRTPMSAILGYADILARHLKDPDDLNCVAIIRNNGNFLLEIINDILDISKIEAGKLELLNKSVRLARLLADVRSLMQVRASEKLLDFSVELEGEIPQSIRTDSKRLKQILLNLVGNAIKFTESGSVKLIVRHLPDAHPQSIQFEIVDTGIGISQSQQQKLFEPFMQADASVNRKFGGTGLGLTISQRLAEMLGGTITVESEPGRGSRFWLTIASRSEANASMIDNAKLIAANPGEKQAPAQTIKLDGHILVVDDRREIRFIAQHFIEDAGGTVVTAENGEEAIAMVARARNGDRPFDALVMDMQMPVLDGYEAARRLRASGFDKPIIALTAHAMQGDRDECMAAGCTDYLAKPLDGPHLVRLLGNLLTARD